MLTREPFICVAAAAKGLRMMRCAAKKLILIKNAYIAEKFQLISARQRL